MNNHVKSCVDLSVSDRGFWLERLNQYFITNMVAIDINTQGLVVVVEGDESVTVILPHPPSIMLRGVNKLLI